MKKVVIIDNYDSFTYNLVQLVGVLLKRLYKGNIWVFRNDKVTIKELEKLSPDYIIISPGPCTPKEAGISVEVIKSFFEKVPILGVCLGHQSIAYAFGGKIIRAKKLMHGKASLIYHDGKGIFKEIKSPFWGMRYHSLAVDKETLPSEFEISAETDDGEIMGIRHLKYPVEGIQFHPESIGTSLLAWQKMKKPPEKWDFEKDAIPEGVLILKNFLSIT